MNECSYWVAIGDWPCPRDNEKKRSVIFEDSTRASSVDVGSTPGDNTKMSGMVAMESSRTALTSSTGGSTKRAPSVLIKKEVTQYEIRSRRNARTNRIRWNSVQMSCHSPRPQIASCNAFSLLRTNMWDKRKLTIFLITEVLPYFGGT